jgi:hypothetical protein
MTRSISYLSILVCAALVAGVPASAQDRKTAMFGAISVEVTDDSAAITVRADNRDEIGSIILRCFPREVGMVLMFTVPHHFQRFKGIQQVTLWSDSSPPRDISVTELPGSQGLVAAAVDAPLLPTTTAADKAALLAAMEALAAAKTTISYSVEHRTATLTAVHLAAARARFQHACWAATPLQSR